MVCRINCDTARRRPDRLIQRANPVTRVLLCAPSAGLGIALVTQITSLSWLLQSRYHLPVESIALVWSAGPLAGIIGQLAAGHASDRTWLLGGRRRPWLMISGLLAAGTLFALLHLDAVARALGGISLVLVAGTVALALDMAVNIGLNPARALIGDVMPAGPDRSLTFAWMQTLSGVLGLGISLVGAWFGAVWMIMVASVTTLPLTALPALLVKEPRVLTSGTTFGGVSTRRLAHMLLPIVPATGLVVVLSLGKAVGIALPVGPLLLTSAVLTAMLAARVFGARAGDPLNGTHRILIGQGLSWVGVFTMFVFLAPLVRERLRFASDDRIGSDIAIALGLFNLVAAIAPLLLLVPLTRRFRRAHVHAAALISMGMAFGCIGGLVHCEPALWVCMALAGIGWGSLVSLPYAIFCDRVDARQLGLLLGVFNLAVVIPQLVVSLGLGALAPLLEARGDLFLMAGGALIASALAWSRVPGLPVQPTICSDAAMHPVPFDSGAAQ